jgi:hypothetical protein
MGGWLPSACQKAISASQIFRIGQQALAVKAGRGAGHHELWARRRPEAAAPEAPISTGQSTSSS